MRMDVTLGEFLEKSPKMIRFYANRLVLELGLGRQLTSREQRLIFNNSRVNVLEEVLDIQLDEGGLG